jgi:hypothetical protein
VGAGEFQVLTVNTIQFSSERIYMLSLTSGQLQSQHEY